MKLPQCQPKLLFYRNVENAHEIRSKIMNALLPCAALNLKYILDPFQILVATQLAVDNHSGGMMKTRSVYSEIVYNLSPNKKITDSLKLFGINESDTEILFVVLDENSADAVYNSVKGELRSPSEVKEANDIQLIKKLYKIKEEELIAGSLLEAVVNRISAKEIVTF